MSEPRLPTEENQATLKPARDLVVGTIQARVHPEDPSMVEVECGVGDVTIYFSVDEVRALRDWFNEVLT